MSETLFAAEVMNQTIDMVTKGLRDLRSVSLKPFYRQPEPVSADYVTDAYESVRETMDGADLTPPTKTEFSEQLAEGGSQVFIKFMQDSGVVQAEDSNDIIEVGNEDALPDLGELSDFLSQLRDEGVVTIDMEHVRQLAELLDLPEQPSALLHLSVPNPRSYGELDPIIARRVARMREYVRSYFSG
jgi:hypothetical protein